MAELWIKHDIDSHKDDKIVALIKHHGPEGYGVYWIFNEILTEAKKKGESIDMSQRFRREGIAEKMKMEPDEMMAILQTMVDLELVQRQEDVYTSVSLNKRTDFISNDRSAIARKAAEARWHKDRKKSPDKKESKDELDFGEDEQSQPPAEEKKSRGASKKDKPFVEGNYKFFEDPDFKNAFDQFVAMRVKRRAPMTDYAKHLMMMDVQKRSKGDVKVAAAIFNQSTKGSWTDIYDLKAEEKAAVAAPDLKYRNDVEEQQ